MQATTLSFINLHTHGPLFTNLLRARHESFIVERRWDLPETEGMEFDQYDTPESRWIAIHEGGQILGGFRLTPTTAKCNIGKTSGDFIYYGDSLRGCFVRIN